MNLNINWRSMWALIQKEILDSVRSKWIIAMTLVFALLALVVSYFGSTARGLPQNVVGFRGFELTVVLMLSIAETLIPIIALMLGYGAIVSEKEKGSMDLLASMPMSRTEVFVSKFLGLSMVLFTSIFVGFGVAGAVIAAYAGSANWSLYVAFISASALLGLVFLSLGMLLSTVLKRRSTAMGGAVLLWFLFIFIYSIIIVGVGYALGYLGSGATAPGWYYAFQLFSPVSSYEVMAYHELGYISNAPWFFNGITAWAIVACWILIPVLISLWVFTKKDIQR